MAAPAFSSPDRATRVGVVALTVVVFAVVVTFVTVRLRQGLQAQVLSGHAEMLAAVASLQLRNEAGNVGVANAPGALLAAVLTASKFRDVIAVRIFDADWRVGDAIPFLWSEEPPVPADRAELKAGKTITRLLAPRESRVLLSDLGSVGNPGAAELPLVEAWVPLRETEAGGILGAAQFWSYGASLAPQFAAIDARLVRQALLAWLAGSLVITAALAWAFNRLAAANRELLLRSENLQRANRELALAAKTSALGSITAHLIHALKNPIAGLELFVASQAEPSGRADGGEELAAATELTRRLRSMVNDVVEVLRDEGSNIQFELSIHELVELALAKARPVAAARNVRLAADIISTSSLPARRANLAALALYNLLQNAIEASRAGGSVRVAARTGAGETEFTVSDEGPGLPPAVRARLFEPCPSSKLGGSGLGLALSQQLARHAAGRIELGRSDERGTSFRLVLDPEP